MFPSQTVYPKTNLTGRLPDDEFLGWSHRVALTPDEALEFLNDTDEEILAWLTTCARLRARAVDGELPGGSIASNVAYLEFHQDRALRALEEVERRRAQYERHKQDPRGPREVNRSRYDALVTRAQRIKDQVSLAQFVQDRVLATRLEPRGRDWSGHCPAPDHDDHSPSFTVRDTDTWKCWGCNRGGDIFDLVQLVFGVEGFRHQVQFLEDLLGLGAQP